MLSVILPYWNRQDAADKALSLMESMYRGLDFEVIVVDDGSPAPFKNNSGLKVKIVRLPTKSIPMCPATVWNAGVAAASGDIVVLSCIEILHTMPVLEEMAEQVMQDENNYVLAAAWCPENQAWHCHSSVPVPDCPPGVGIAFCGAMRKSLFEKIGGFDEAYRGGAGYEDRDFILKAVKAGAKFILRDDLVVTHPKTGASIIWPDGGFERNLKIFNGKWLKDRPVIFACVQAGNYCGRGAEYVNTLYDMVRRSLPGGFMGKFVCLTDNAADLDPGIAVMDLPSDLDGWWGKLYLFKRGLFPDGARVIFFDLDTLILGDLEAITRYTGQFATLNDFYHPSRVGPAVMLWEAGGHASSIWDEWVAQGKPRNAMGDLWWINQLDEGQFAKRADKLQDLFPGAFVSFKADCLQGPPNGTKVVCFHGKPRPHEASEGWVKGVWKIGGAGLADLEIVSNTEADQVIANVTAACARPLPWLQKHDLHEGHALIVGGGPSVADNLEEIKFLAQQGHTIVALNGAAQYLRRKGVKVDWQVILDARSENARFIDQAQRYFICSQCDPSVFDAADPVKTTVFHVNTRPTICAVPKDREAHLISTGSTVGLIAMGILFLQGFKNIHLYGMDSSYTENHHAYEQRLNDSDTVVEATVEGRTFKCAPWMVAQVTQFQEVATQLAEAGCTITVAGDGLLPHVARLMSQPQEITT